MDKLIDFNEYKKKVTLVYKVKKMYKKYFVKHYGIAQWRNCYILPIFALVTMLITCTFLKELIAFFRNKSLFDIKLLDVCLLAVIDGVLWVHLNKYFRCNVLDRKTECYYNPFKYGWAFLVISTIIATIFNYLLYKTIILRVLICSIFTILIGFFALNIAGYIERPKKTERKRGQYKLRIYQR